MTSKKANSCTVCELIEALEVMDPEAKISVFNSNSDYDEPVLTLVQKNGVPDRIVITGKSDD